MRIIGGRAGGLILKVPKGLAVRPTPDLVKQAVFNSLGDRVVDAEVLELFAGTGALSLECVSRGARLAVCVERSARHASFLRENWRRAGFPPETLELRIQDVFAALEPLVMSGRSFDLILADPPYGPKNLQTRSESAAQRLLDDPWLPRLLRPGGRFILGHARRDRLELTPAWREVKVLRHGDSVMRFLEACLPGWP
ncbi:methyltransferase domain-containing protein [Limisphaera ngatamarikiensis]|uniref:Methyltransferase domain-containing protein n=1 Tax=Limisphaera ngatamarikiensis TaxID=1324935 RepID=A0A6M1RM11_9BACT|nr:RsmD family RNA methyltransferase [Limisphaera ngatamarikiensis]NGO38497.1 methyltransferase domain-containing protein [Limisphaera ngatamarikiensis]